MQPLVLGPALRRRIQQLATDALPREACGLLLGVARAEHRAVLEVTSARNLATAPDRFELDPVHLMQSESRADETNRTVLGVWHSHPTGAAVPSSHDRRGAYAGWSYVIAAADPSQPTSLRSWRLSDADFVEEPIADGAPQPVARGSATWPPQAAAQLPSAASG